MRLGLENKVVLITGSSRGIGKTMAEAFVQEGCIVVLNDILADTLKETVEEFRANGANVYGYAFDITDPEQAAAAVDRIEAEVGPVTVLINNAGLTKRYPLEEFPLSEWTKIISVDLTGSFIMAQTVARKMIPRRDGRIINVTSINAELVRETISAYCAAKGGLKNLTKSMAAEWGKYGIRANAVGPGYVITDINRSLAEDPAFDSWVKSEVPLCRWGEKEELTGAVVFLASDASSYITGQTIYIDGGWQTCL